MCSQVEILYLILLTIDLYNRSENQRFIVLIIINDASPCTTLVCVLICGIVYRENILIIIDFAEILLLCLVDFLAAECAYPKFKLVFSFYDPDSKIIINFNLKKIVKLP